MKQVVRISNYSIHMIPDVPLVDVNVSYERPIIVGENFRGPYRGTLYMILDEEELRSFLKNISGKRELTITVEQCIMDEG